MTDDVMEARLREAGERWRAATDVSAPTEARSVHVVDLVAHDRKRRRTRWSVLASAAAVVALAGGVAGFYGTRSDHHAGTQAAGPGPAPTSMPIIGPTWHLVRAVDARGKEIPVTAATTIAVTIKFEGGRVSGDDGCNTVGGPASVGSDTIRYGHIASTVVGCPAATARPGISIVPFVSGTVRWHVDSGRLTLSKQGVGTLVFQQSASSGTVATPLKGTWRLTGVEQTKGSTASGMAATWMTTGVTFDGAGHVLINHRCYVNKGDVVIGRSTLTVSGVTLETAIPCAATRDQRTEQTVNTLLDSVLRGTSTYRVEQRTLSITKGATALTFTKV